MTKIKIPDEFPVSSQDLFKFLTKPKNLELVYPKRLNVKIIEGPEKIKEGDIIRMRSRILGQKFEWKILIKEFKENEGFTDEALDSPFKFWKHRHEIKSINDKTLMEDIIEYKTYLGFLGDKFAYKMIKNIIEYRNLKIKEIFGIKIDKIEFKDPTIINLKLGLFICLFMSFLGFILPIISPRDSIINFILNFIAWFLLWFFTHDLAHFIVGYFLSIRFSYFYIGLSNLIRVLPLKQFQFIFIVLGLKIDRKRSKASNRRFAAMYFAGPLASMLLPFYVPVYLILYKYSLIAVFILLLSLINLLITSILSPKYGCIYKGLNKLKI
jgi:Uncharacterized conserved protein